MTVLRVVVEVTGVELSDGDVGGFFAAEIVRDNNPESAIRQTSDRFEAQRGVRPGHVAMVDVWRVGWIASLRRKPFGFVFYDDEARADAADVIADAAGAPKGSTIRQIASGAA